MREFKHDYQNLLFSLHSYIAEGDLEGLRSYYDQTILPTRQMMNLFPANLSMLDNMKVPEIRSLLSLKLMMAQEKGLIVQLHFPKPIELDTKHTVNLVRMLGIILDNAIEGASARKEEKDRIDNHQEKSFRDDSRNQYNNKYITVKPVETKRFLNKNKSKKRRTWVVYLG